MNRTVSVLFLLCVTDAGRIHTHDRAFQNVTLHGALSKGKSASINNAVMHYHLPVPIQHEMSYSCQCELSLVESCRDVYLFIFFYSPSLSRLMKNCR